jgi:tetratricopeptide (TPR) repeat protein
VIRGVAGRLAVIGLGVVMGACATVAEPEKQKPSASGPATPGSGRPAVAAPPTTPPPPKVVDPRETLVARHRDQAQALEKDGQLRRALEEWKIALTVDPNDAESKQGLQAVEGRIEQAVAQRIEAGRAALARGVQVEARRQFLIALALDPTNRVAFDALQTQAREVEFVTHTVKQGDTLGSLAQRYYGDRSRSEVIWETNQLPPNPKLTAGMMLKIPEIPGVPFIHQEAPRRPTPAPPAVATPGAPAKPEATAEEAQPPQPEMVNPLLAEAREALGRNDYGEAISDIDKFLAGNPNHPDGLAVKKQALYQQGKAQFSERRYEDSYKALSQLARLQPDYEDSAALMKQARASAIDLHYREGVRLYREEKPAEAIVEWKVVLDLDPQHANAKRNIDQAERLLKALAERKKR